MSNSDKGFASMDKEKVKEAASKGGQSSGGNKAQNSKDDKVHPDGHKNNDSHSTSKNHK